jgi:hypothetical protein
MQTYDPFPSDLLWNVEDVIECADGGFAVNGSYIDENTYAYGFVLKTDSEGNFEWADKDTVSFQYENESRAIVETEDGGILSASNTTSGGTAMIKRSLDGVREYTNCLEQVYVRSMCKAYDGNIVTAGKIRIDNIPWPSLTKLDQNAEIIWSQTYEFEDYEWGIIKSVIQSSDGGYLLAGYVEDIKTGHAILVIKTDANGDSLWTRVLDETSLDDNGRTIVEAEEGNIFIGGRKGYLSDVNGFIWKLDCNGNSIWIEDCGYEVTSLINSNDGAIISLYGDPVFNNGIRKFDDEFNIEWSNDLPYYNGSGDKAVKITDNGNIVVALFEPSFIALSKLNPDGTDTNENIVNISETILNVYPNPFNPCTRINFIINEHSKVKLQIYNIKGQLVDTLLNENKHPGEYSLIWSPHEISSGIYFAKLLSNNEILDTKKITLLK